MTRRPSPKSGPVPAELTHDQMRSGADRLALRIADLEKFDVSQISQRGDPRVLALEASIEETLQRVFGAGTIEFKRYSAAARLHRLVATLSTGFGRSSGPPLDEIQSEFDRLRGNAIALLGQAVKGLEEEIAHNSHPMAEVEAIAPREQTRKVFIVHGHDGEPREAVAGFLRKIDFIPVILGEQTNQGRTIVEKFEDHSDVDFAVVLLTPDDVGGPKGGDQQPRARQNVILELGYFIGKLGRKNVCAIKVGDLEIPSDFIGVVWTPFDLHNAWKTALAKELRDAGHDIDWNKVMGP